MTKPVVQMKDAKIIYHNYYGGSVPEGILYGTVLDYPDHHQYYPGCLTNGKPVYTTSIINHDGDTVETVRTIYKVLNWIE